MGDAATSAAPAARAPYNLMTKGIHDSFLFFDNCDSDDRLVIFITIRRLKGEENEMVKVAIRQRHGEGAVHRRLDPSSSFSGAEMQFLKYCIVYRDGGYRIFDMDSLEEVSATSGNALRTFRVGDRRPMENVRRSQRALHMGFDPHLGVLSDREAVLRFSTKKHGLVRIRLSTYSDPEVRNGITLGVQKNLGVHTAWGACVKAIHPKYLLQRRFLRLPDLLRTEEDVRARNTDDYWETVSGVTERQNRIIPTRVSIPKHEKHKYI